MNSQQMLDKLGVTAEQAKEYKKRSSAFASSLPNTLMTLHKKTKNPATPNQVRKWFGADVTQNDLAKLYKAAPGLKGVVMFTNLDTTAAPHKVKKTVPRKGRKASPRKGR